MMSTYNGFHRFYAPTSRRRFLRGASITLALPWLESIPGAPVSADEFPVRFGCVYFSNGVEPEHWWAEGQGPDMKLGQALQPMHDLREHMVFVRGLFNEKAWAHPSPHMGRMANLLSGAEVSSDPGVIRVGQSFDQLLAEELSGKTALPSLVLGVEPSELRLEDGLSMLYGSSISWASASRPITKEIYPSRVYDQITGANFRRQIHRSVLDEVLEDAVTLRREISKADRDKLDEYSESLRTIEKRIDRASVDGRLEGMRDVSQLMKRPEESLPQDVPEHMQLMLDLIVLAFRLGRTRIATCMLNNDLSQMNFNFLQGVEGSLHLDLTHNGRDPVLESMYLRTNQFHLNQFAYLCRQMQNIPEGDGTLLDHSVLMICSNLLDGDRHQADELPIVLAGSASGALKTGRVLNYRDRPDEQRRACSLYLSIMDWMGITKSHFGDASSRLDNI